MKLIIGLGNPGKEYENTRHNAGWLVLDKLAQKERWTESRKAECLYLKTELSGKQVELIKPLAYMNNSGASVAYAVKKHSLKPEDIWVIYDDLALPLGKIRIGVFNSSGGHNGIKSVIQHLKTSDFVRFRAGIKTPLSEKIPAEKFVTQKFTASEQKLLKVAIEKITEAVLLALTEPLAKVMNQYN